MKKKKKDFNKGLNKLANVWKREKKKKIIHIT